MDNSTVLERASGGISTLVLSVIVLFAVVMLVGLVGNLLVILTVCCNRPMLHQPTNIFVFNLAVADLLFICGCVPLTATSYYFAYWPFGTVVCKIWKFIINCTLLASVYTMVLMTFDRYIAVVHPLRALYVRKATIVWRMVALLWLIVVALCSPLLLEFTVSESYMVGNVTRNVPICHHSSGPEVQFVYYLLQTTVGFFVPLLVILLLYSQVLRSILNRRAASLVNTDRKRVIKVTKMVVAIIITFTICWLPQEIIYVNKLVRSELPAMFRVVAQCMGYVNSCCNPILYAFLNDNLRSGFVKLLCYWRGMAADADVVSYAVVKQRIPTEAGGPHTALLTKLSTTTGQTPLPEDTC